LDSSYIGALAILVVSLLKVFGVEVGNEAIAGIITGVVAIFIAYKQKTEKNLTIGGVRKV